MDIEEIIEKTAHQTAEAMIEKLREKGLIRISNKTAIDKTIDLLNKYEFLKLSDSPDTLKQVAQIDVALEKIRSDPFYAIIPMTFFEKMSRENIAYHFGVNEKTITNKRNRLVRQMSVILFSDDVIRDILS